ncbi:Drug/metabolite transporter [Cynara cardunculus var. scolymus]|uniref:WAT1-related protein n=1 Tax=Cynara cardunculus var. scolymus TaxID=59895 RepID=A0A118K6V7_CYNCS|nr:Drug/metabolite transporter [Cynara cardunculus var. scolymus]
MVQEILPLLMMVIVQIEFAGMNIFSKLALDSGMNPFIHVAYRQLFASVTLTPLAYFIERLTMNQITYFVGLKYSTPTIACALSNLLPALTFVLAAKLFGTFIGVGGAMLLSMYHGPIVPIGESSIHLTIADMAKDPNQSGQGNSNLLGPFLVILSSLTWAIWFILQARMCNKYPVPYSSSALMLSMATVECLAFGFIMEPRLHEWSLFPPIRAFSSIYAGVVCSAMGVCMMSWCIERKGPLFVSVFSPLLLVIVAALSWALLREKLYLGTVLGSVLIVIGLYGVLWGKSKEMEPLQHQEELKDTKDVDMEMQ